MNNNNCSAQLKPKLNKRNHITNRSLLRIIHIICAILIAYYVYFGYQRGAGYHLFLKYVIIPLITINGLWMWKSRFIKAKLNKGITTFGIGIFMALLAVYLIFWPLPIEPEAWIPPEIPVLSGEYEPNSRLSSVQRLLEGVGVGPEAVTYDKQGSLFAGLEDGRIIQFKPDGKDYAVFCNTGGRPAGLKFDFSGNLIVADAKKGLLSIAPTGSIEILAKEADGVPINLANDLDIGSDGTIYFSDSSTKHSSVMLDLFEHRPNGRLLSYSPDSRTVKVLLEGLYFPNGVAISPDQSFLLVNEMWKYRVRRYWLKGDKKGQTDIFIDNLPGLPDNITSNGKGIFWLALLYGPEGRKSFDKLLPRPFLRKLLLRLPDLLKPAPKRMGYVIGLNSNGKVICNLQDPKGEKYAGISSVIEREGILYLGSISENAIGCIAAPKSI